MRRLLLVLAALAATTAAAGCSSTPAPAMPPVTAPGPTSSDLDPADAGFVATLREQDLAPADFPYPDAVFVTDANAVCQVLAIPGETAQVKATDLENMRKTRVNVYGLTPDQATQLMVLSAQTYCPEQVATVQSALDR